MPKEECKQVVEGLNRQHLGGEDSRDDITGSCSSGMESYFTVRYISTDPQVPLCFRSAEEAGRRGRSREMSLVEQLSIKESSLLSSDLSRTAGWTLSAESNCSAMLFNSSL